MTGHMVEISKMSKDLSILYILVKVGVAQRCLVAWSNESLTHSWLGSGDDA